MLSDPSGASIRSGMEPLVLTGWRGDEEEEVHIISSEDEESAREEGVGEVGQAENTGNGFTELADSVFAAVRDGSSGGANGSRKRKHLSPSSSAVVKDKVPSQVQNGAPKRLDARGYRKAWSGKTEVAPGNGTKTGVTEKGKGPASEDGMQKSNSSKKRKQEASSLIEQRRKRSTEGQSAGPSKTVSSEDTTHWMSSQWVTCSACKKWRRVPFEEDVPCSSWQCKDNVWSSKYTNCDEPQEQEQVTKLIPQAVFTMNMELPGFREDMEEYVETVATPFIKDLSRDHSDAEEASNPGEKGEVVCEECRAGGQLISCSGAGCKKRCHAHCMKLDAHRSWKCKSCSEGIFAPRLKGEEAGEPRVESIWPYKAPTQDGEEKYYVKWENRAHIHNTLMSESEIKKLASKKLLAFQKKSKVGKTLKWDPSWTEPQRLIAERSSPDSSRIEWLVKWKGLGYERSTWESADHPLFSTEMCKALVQNYVRWRECAKRQPQSEQQEKVTKKFTKLANQPEWIQDGPLQQHQFEMLNKLRECWCNQREGIVLSEMNKEQMVPVVAFAISLFREYSIQQPVLVLTSTERLQLWELKLAEWAPDLNAVIYTGSLEARQLIQQYEFDVLEGFRVQIVISSFEAMTTDVEFFKAFRWGTLLVDQRIKAGLYQCIAQLQTSFRMIFSPEPAEYILEELHQILALFDRESTCEDESLDIREKIRNHVVCDYNADATPTVLNEFWIPVQMSPVQIHEYCGTLTEHFELLRSGNICHGDMLLGNLVQLLRSYCCHPYTVSDKLFESVGKIVPSEGLLAAGIKASGKLELMHNMLQELWANHKRVLILIQSARAIKARGRKLIDILDDYLRQQYGSESYERIERGMELQRKQAGLQRFNATNSKCFALLSDRTDTICYKLKSLDAVFIYESDWNPSHDTAHLQRMGITSNVNVYRLYSCLSIEEAMLVYSQQGGNMDRNMKSVSAKLFQEFVRWGAKLLLEIDYWNSKNGACTDPRIGWQLDGAEEWRHRLVFFDIEEVKALTSGNDDLSKKLKVILTPRYSSAEASPLYGVCPSDDQNVSAEDFWSPLLKEKHGEVINLQRQRVRKHVKYHEEESESNQESLEAIRNRVTGTQLTQQNNANTLISEQSRKKGKVHKGRESENRGVVYREVAVNVRAPDCEVQPHTSIVGNKAVQYREVPTPNEKRLTETQGNPAEEGKGRGKKRKLNMVTSAAADSPRELKDEEPRSLSQGEVSNKPTEGNIVKRYKDGMQLAEETQKESASGDHTQTASSGQTGVSQREQQQELLKSTKVELKALCELLKFPLNVLQLAESYLEFVMKNLRMREDLLQEVELSMCWIAAESMAVEFDISKAAAMAVSSLGFEIDESKLNLVYSRLKEKLSHRWKSSEGDRREEAGNLQPSEGTDIELRRQELKRQRSSRLSQLLNVQKQEWCCFHNDWTKRKENLNQQHKAECMQIQALQVDEIQKRRLLHERTKQQQAEAEELARKEAQDKDQLANWQTKCRNEESKLVKSRFDQLNYGSSLDPLPVLVFPRRPSFVQEVEDPEGALEDARVVENGCVTCQSVTERADEVDTSQNRRNKQRTDQQKQNQVPLEETQQSIRQRSLQLQPNELAVPLNTPDTQPVLATSTQFPSQQVRPRSGVVHQTVNQLAQPALVQTSQPANILHKSQPMTSQSVNQAGHPPDKLQTNQTQGDRPAVLQQLRSLPNLLPQIQTTVVGQSVSLQQVSQPSQPSVVQPNQNQIQASVARHSQPSQPSQHSPVQPSQPQDQAVVAQPSQHQNRSAAIRHGQAAVVQPSQSQSPPAVVRYSQPIQSRGQPVVVEPSQPQSPPAVIRHGQPSQPQVQPVVRSTQPPVVRHGQTPVSQGEPDAQTINILQPQVPHPISLQPQNQQVLAQARAQQNVQTQRQATNNQYLHAVVALPAQAAAIQARTALAGPVRQSRAPGHLTVVPDPLQREESKLQGEFEKNKREHENAIIKLELEEQKEMEEIKRKYERLREEENKAYSAKNEPLHQNIEAVRANRRLSEALRRKKDTSVNSARSNPSSMVPRVNNPDRMSAPHSRPTPGPSMSSATQTPVTRLAGSPTLQQQHTTMNRLASSPTIQQPSQHWQVAMNNPYMSVSQQHLEQTAQYFVQGRVEQPQQHQYFPNRMEHVPDHIHLQREPQRHLHAGSQPNLTPAATQRRTFDPARPQVSGTGFIGAGSNANQQGTGFMGVPGTGSNANQQGTGFLGAPGAASNLNQQGSGFMGVVGAGSSGGQQGTGYMSQQDYFNLVQVSSQNMYRTIGESLRRQQQGQSEQIQLVHPQVFQQPRAGTDYICIDD